MTDPLGLPTDIRSRLSPVAARAVEQAGYLAAGNGRSLAGAEDILISLLIDGGDEPEFAALLGRSSLDMPILAKGVLRAGRGQAVPVASEARARLSAYWSELGQIDSRIPLDCTCLLGALLRFDFLSAATRRLLIESGFSASETAWPPSSITPLDPREPGGSPPFGRLLIDEAVHVSFARERLCQRLAAEYRDGRSLLIYGPPGIGKHFLARQSALAAGRLTVELCSADLVGLSARERAMRLAELAAYLEARSGGLLLADADDPRLRGQLSLPAKTPLLATSQVPRLALRLVPGRRLAHRQIPPLERTALLRTLSAWQSETGQPRLAADDLPAAVELADSFLPEIGAMPGAAIDLIHVAEVRQRQGRTSGPIGRDSLEEAVHYLTHLPKALISAAERERLVSLESRLGARIIGQRSAISALCRAIIRHELSLREPDRPVGSFLFVGPTGVGKTELAKALAQELYGTSSALVRFDMGEYQQDHEISKLIGSPPGYIGSDRDGQLIAALKKQQRIVLLLDEIEKAHPRVYDFLLGALDYGVVTSSQGQKTSLLEAVVIMTSNIGSGARAIGFIEEERGDERAARGRASAVHSHFASRPEFLNRLDGVIEFSPLSLAELDAVLELRLRAYAAAYERIGLHIELGSRLRSQMVAEAYASGLGARELTARRFNAEVEDRVAEALLAGAYTRGASLRIELDGTGRPNLERREPTPAPGPRAH